MSSSFLLAHSRRPSRSTRFVLASKGSKGDAVSQEARLRSEVASPFRVARIFLVGAVGAGAGIGTLVATAQLLGAMASDAGPESVSELAKTLAVDLGGVAACGWWLRRDLRARDAQIARMEREARLSQLRLELGNGKSCAAGDLRGFHRLVLVAGSQDFLSQAQESSLPHRQELLQRGVMYVPVPMDEFSAPPDLETEPSENIEGTALADKSKSEAGQSLRWKATPLRLDEWRRWIRDQKKLAGVPEESGVYVSLRMDGRVRGSGVRLPPWDRMAKQLAPTQGIWKGFGDGFDGAV